MSYFDSHLFDIGFGSREERRRFKEAHPSFFRCIPGLRATATKVFVRRFLDRGRTDRVVFYLGNIVAENFPEIVSLAGNGFGIGALELLRNMYERVVTVGVIAKEPERASQFLAFHAIEQGKLLQHAKDSKLPVDVPPEMALEIEEASKKAKQQFGNRQRWVQEDLLSLARRLPIPGGTRTLANLYLPCYFEPTLHAHPTVTSIVRRLRRSPSGIGMDPEPARKWASHSAMFAHELLLHLFRFENQYFDLGLEAEIQGLVEEADAAWSGTRGDSDRSNRKPGKPFEGKEGAR